MLFGILRIFEVEALNPDSEISLLRSNEFFGNKLAEDDVFRLLVCDLCWLSDKMITFLVASKTRFLS